MNYDDFFMQLHKQSQDEWINEQLRRGALVPSSVAAELAAQQIAHQNAQNSAYLSAQLNAQYAQMQQQLHRAAQAVQSKELSTFKIDGAPVIEDL